MNAIDTNVLVYFIDQHESAKRAKTIKLFERLDQEETETALLWQVAVGFLSCLRQCKNEGRIDRPTTQQHVEHLETTFRCIMPSANRRRIA